jgi:glycosyltransferase involved in cell wall biosynthesis
LEVAEMSRVDIVVPCYNYGRFLEACIQSVLEQSHTDFRLLIIDDASSDDTPAIAEKLARTDRRISFISHSQNWGHAKSFNQGIDWASGDYFLLLSADDLLAPGALERAAEVMDEHPEIVLTHGKTIPWQNDTPFPQIEGQQNYTWTQHDLLREMCEVGANLVGCPSAIGRTYVQKLIGGYRVSLLHTGDLEMWLRYAAQGAVAKIDAVQAIYRIHSSNMSHAYYTTDYQHRKAAFDCFFDEYANCIAESHHLWSQADRALANGAFVEAVRLILVGIRESRRDRISGGFQLLRWSVHLNPRLRYAPPLAELVLNARQRLSETRG